ncbi:hypothetical protein [Cupriavidus basilensis]|uniref:hypothetical protein n=2 Tax=Cupriavidus basilensis TaxID=68895 RepID=UPI0023E7B31B|nr:hypothetical protein [Cupriavidus basilensis]MDF3884562.1 hypothetical protein [Cupriavidus basilensis]
MTTLVIKDLSSIEELDGSTMAEVRGGWLALVAPFHAFSTTSKLSDPPPAQTQDTNPQYPLSPNNPV